MLTTKREIRENGLVGTLFEPETASTKKLPAIIVVPGSDGGVPEAFALHLAEQEYIVLALGYFGFEGLPEFLENIHLEYFEKAHAWLCENPRIGAKGIGVVGYSRGGELVLLLGSLFPHLFDAIAAYVPSSVVFGGFPHPNRPAWSHRNAPISPFVGALMSDDKNFTECEELTHAARAGLIPFHQNTAEDPFELSELFEARNETTVIFDAAAIKVEKIQCPLLILTSKQDKIWPSALYGKQIIDRLNRHESTIERKHISYPEAGHGLVSHYEGPIYHPVGQFWCRLGGTLQGNVVACEESWQELLTFLGSNLRAKFEREE